MINTLNKQQLSCAIKQLVQQSQLFLTNWVFANSNSYETTQSQKVPGWKHCSSKVSVKSRVNQQFCCRIKAPRGHVHVAHGLEISRVSRVCAETGHRGLADRNRAHGEVSWTHKTFGFSRLSSDKCYHLLLNHGGMSNQISDAWIHA